MSLVIMRNGEIVRQTTIHLPQALADETKGLGINRSKVAEKALRAEVERVKKEREEQEEEPQGATYELVSGT